MKMHKELSQVAKVVSAINTHVNSPDFSGSTGIVIDKTREHNPPIRTDMSVSIRNRAGVLIQDLNISIGLTPDGDEFFVGTTHYAPLSNEQGEKSYNMTIVNTYFNELGEPIPQAPRKFNSDGNEIIEPLLFASSYTAPTELEIENGRPVYIDRDTEDITIIDQPKALESMMGVIGSVSRGLGLNIREILNPKTDN